MITGIIAEFNPFHNGHEYLIKKAKEDSDAVICVMSGNFVQRGDISIYDKFTRTAHALNCGADLVILLPSCWSMSCAENFALGGVSLLKSTGIVDRIAFGCENSNVDLLNKIAELRDDYEFNNVIKKHLNNGNTYAKSYELALNDIDASYSEIATKPNNILGIEYIYAAKKLSYNVDFKAIDRIGVSHDSFNANGNYMSASAIREKIHRNDFEGVEHFIPDFVYSDIKNKNISKLNNLNNTLLYHLRSKDKDFFKNLPDINEGLENRIYEKIKTSKNFTELINNVSTKRYTSAHIRRLLLSAAFEIDNSFFKKEPPYIKILGYNNIGKNIVSEIKSKAKVPVVLTSDDYLQLTDNAKKLFESECISNDLYNMSFDTPIDSSSDLTTSIIKVK